MYGGALRDAQTQSWCVCRAGNPFAVPVTLIYAANMPDRTTEQKFWDGYEKYMIAKDRDNRHQIKLYAMWAIGELHNLVGLDKYKDKNECAKVIANLFSAIGMSQAQALETYEELHKDSRPI